jgi:ERCC4 domain
MDDFLIARNPDPESKLPYLLRLPLGSSGVVLKAREMWPRTAKVFCHPEIEWPESAEVLQRVGVRSCVRRGAAIDLLLDRGQENRSMFVFSKARGRDVIFWQSARTAKQARPNVTVPTSRAVGRSLEIIVDSHERYAWNFARQQATTIKRALTIGDYAVEHNDAVVAVVERKSLEDFVGTLTGGKLRYLLAALASVEHSALVVEERYSSVFKLDRVRPLVIAEGIAEAHIRFPTVPIVFAETRLLAQEWTYRFFGAALAHRIDSLYGELHADELAEALPLPPLPPREPTLAVIRAWALASGIAVAAKGRLRPEIRDAYNATHPKHTD